MKLKKLLYTLLFIVTFFASSLVVNAASLKVTISSSSTKVVVGNTVTYTVTLSSTEYLGSIRYNFGYDSDKLTLLSGTLNAAPVFDGTKKSVSYTFKFRATASGTANVSFNIYEAVDWNANNFSYNGKTTKSISVITQSQLESSYSKNNYLSKLSVDGYNIDPQFNKNTSEYSLTLENDIRNINITGTKEDSKSTVTGLGSHELIEGLNKINIVVTAQNGSSRTYVLNVTVKELAPINVEVDGNTYSVVRKKEQIESPNSNYKETTVEINNEEIPAFINDVTNTTLVGLKDKDGNVSLYIYNEGNYKLYKEFTFESIIVTEASIDEIPEGYSPTSIKIGDEEINAYTLDDDKSYYLVSATNISTGEKNLYQYNPKENTLQIFNTSLITKIDALKSENENYIYIIIGLGVLLIVTYLVILISCINNRNKSKKRKKRSKLEQNDENYYSNEEKDDKMEEDISKKTKKEKE